MFIDFKKENQIEFSSGYKTRVTINNVVRVNAIKIKPISDITGETTKAHGIETDMMIITSKNSETYFDKYGNVHVKIR